MVRLFPLVALLIFLTAPLRSSAQTVMLMGTVTTPDHDPVMGASVVLTPLPRSARTSTDATGTFRFTDVSPGTYQLSVTAPGYEPLRATEIHIGGSGATPQGVPYPGKSSAISTDAYSLPARTLTLTLSKHV